MDVTADDMPVLSGTTTSSTDEGSFGQLAADSLTQGSTAADAGIGSNQYGCICCLVPQILQRLTQRQIDSALTLHCCHLLQPL